MTDIFASAVGAALGASFPGMAITVGHPPADATAPSLFFTVVRFYSSGGDPKVAVKIRYFTAGAPSAVHDGSALLNAVRELSPGDDKVVAESYECKAYDRYSELTVVYSGEMAATIPPPAYGSVPMKSIEINVSFI